MSSMKDQRFLGFKKEICVKDGSSWSDQTFTVRAKFEVKTLTGLEDLIYEDNCECDIKTPQGCHKPLEVVVLYDGSESMEDKFKEKIYDFIKKTIKLVDYKLMRDRSQEPITFTLVQFSGCDQLVKNYEPGFGYYDHKEMEEAKGDVKKAFEKVSKKPGFKGRLGMAAPGQYHWKMGPTFSSSALCENAYTQLDGFFNTEELLKGSSNLFLALQDISTKEFKETSSKLMASKTSKKDVDRVLIVITDDKAFDASEVKNLRVAGQQDLVDAVDKQQAVWSMVYNQFKTVYPVIFKTADILKPNVSRMFHDAGLKTDAFYVDEVHSDFHFQRIRKTIQTSTFEK
ncbi:unnamed protein product [Oikopleura dioica]|uniref:VWFA domain-containing protein n=1 Tax=Oikopleura dioica TaxID=34765 RepID=E4WZ52_OIKDI|nr:unnamed protein product [Oikopleura dioica]